MCLLGSYLIHLFGVRFLPWTGRIPIKYQRTAVQKLFRIHHRPRWCGRSREVTWLNKNGERLNGIKTSTNISFKTRNSYGNSASKTISCFESLSDSDLLLSLFMKRTAIFLYCSAHVLPYLIHRVTTEYAEMFCLTWFTSSFGSTLSTQNSMNQVRPSGVCW